eukprot:2551850-Alexandrium_andersonii.AAC.1
MPSVVEAGCGARRSEDLRERMLRRVLRRAQEAPRAVQRGVAPQAALCAKLVQQAARLGAA